ncbi:Radical SAM domain protein [Thalassoporum mexicanum PCC 7367]|uniref:B12-binding domain-containing radical SAM protein n=1 Tax=Thalassoporum mexicanum TaxID=3457544 RepID=UPI00029FB3BE|nr:radical SAM protein [Pseudanabaena sp. PCC 7367]AFY69772.1 Radical SAM domain protein [Pseudanabaena sp. PCC 7367]
MISAPFNSEKLLFTPMIPDHDAIGVVFAFPNTYTIGITSLGYQAVWANLTTRPELAVSRWFTDVHEPLPREVELLGISFSWELDYVNILNALNSLGIPIQQSDRTNDHPLVFGGGTVLSANPEPFAAWFDLILIGDGEDLIGNMLAAYAEVRDGDRASQLKHLAQVPGVYVPSMYAVSYGSDDGAIEAITPISPDIPAQINKQTYRGNTLTSSTVVTEKAAWESIYMVEVVRSCPEMCRFCLASYLTLPFRTPDAETSLIPAIDRGVAVTNRLGLLGASITQHPEFELLLDYLAQPKFDDLRLSLASVRTNTLTLKLAQTLSKRDSRSVTVAVESGSERLRQIINKKLTNDQIAQAAINAQEGGLSSLKLYGMVGVPGEIDSDLEATVEMLYGLRQVAPKLRLSFGCSTFVPKSHTPWQWLGVSKSSDKKLKFLQKRLAAKGIDFRPESYKDSLTQALISRGDRRVTRVLELAYGYSNGEVPSNGSYKRAFKELSMGLGDRLPPLDYYVHENWQPNQILPWQHLNGPLPTGTLIKHLESSQALVIL